MPTLASTLLLTLLLAVGLVFFLRAASKDRTTVVEVHSPRPALEVLEGLTGWLHRRGWQREGGDPERQTLLFRGQVGSSTTLALLLSLLGSVGAACLGLVVRQVLPSLGWWPLLLARLGPGAALIDRRRAERAETFELRLLEAPESSGSTLRLRAHRDELIAIETELAAIAGQIEA
ncbi:MAG: cofactor assembly of complex C subunit B, partial [Cyanobium sp.]